MANAAARFFSRRLSSFWRPLRCRSSKEIAYLFVSLQQGFDSEAELAVSLASLAQITIALLTWKAQSFREDGNIRIRSTVHFANRAFCHLRAEFNLRTDDVDSTLRRFITAAGLPDARPKSVRHQLTVLLQIAKRGRLS